MHFLHVPFHRVHKAKGPATHITSMVLILVMDELVLLKVVLVLERFAAYVARVGSGVAMR